MAQSTGNGGGGDYKTFAGAGFGTLMVQLASARRRRRRARRAVPTFATGCPRCTPRATSGCASSVRSRRCSTRSWRYSTRCPSTSIPTSAARHPQPPQRLAGRRPRRVAGDRGAARHDPAAPPSSAPARDEGRPGARALARVPRRPAARGGRGRGHLWSATDNVGIKTVAVRRVLRQARQRSVQAAIARCIESSSRYTPHTGYASRHPRRNPRIMRVCSSCGRENPDDRDFCECGEYLRWDPTGVVQAITPEVLQAAQQERRQAPGADAPAPRRPGRRRPSRRTPRPAPHRPPRPPPGNGQGAPAVSGDPLPAPRRRRPRLRRAGRRRRPHRAAARRPRRAGDPAAAGCARAAGGAGSGRDLAAPARG